MHLKCASCGISNSSCFAVNYSFIQNSESDGKRTCHGNGLSRNRCHFSLYTSACICAATGSGDCEECCCIVKNSVTRKGVSDDCTSQQGKTFSSLEAPFASTNSM